MRTLLAITATVAVLTTAPANAMSTGTDDDLFYPDAQLDISQILPGLPAIPGAPMAH